MNAFRSEFTEKHTFLPVIHVKKTGETLSGCDIGQVIRNVDIARSCDADGAFLIGHGHVENADLIELHRMLYARYPDFWLGINFLRASNRFALSSMPENAGGLWTDNAGVTDVSDADAREFAGVSQDARWRGIYFGGVAFKRQQQIANLEAVARRAVPFVDVITTSGEQTGSAPSVEKIRTMKRGGGNHPLAIASGMNPENVHDFLIADCFLVATGISKSFYELDEKKVCAFSKQLDHSAYEPMKRAS